jgi:GPH family glycoside/pentoside/hexuronide:cation symporter
MESNFAASKPIPVRKQLIYSLSELGSNPIYTITLSFLTFFYTDVMGINAGVVGIVILVSRMFDGLSDIWAGNVIDHTHVKSGSARPWLLWTAFPLALSYVALFAVPNWSEVGKVIYIFVSYNFAMTLVFTFFNSSINALPIYMTDDTKSRSSSYAIRLIVAGLVQAVLSFVFMNVIDAMGGNQTAWIQFAAILGTISFAACLITYAGTKEHIAPVRQTNSDVKLLEALKSTIHNKYWFMVLGIILILVLHQISTLTVGVYYAKYILHDETLAGNLVLYHHMGGAVGMLIMPFLLQKGFSKRNATLAGGFFMLAGSLLSIYSSEGAFLIISLALRGCGFGIVSSAYLGMLADTVDYGEWKNGVRNPAVTTCAGTFGQKLGSGLGTALFGLALSAVGYDGLAASQPESAISCIRFMFTVLPALLYTALIVLALLYKLDKEYPFILKELEARRSSLSGKSE